ncbi:bifunctional UDP-N-acetylglucosamine diphosphorylase/glucosamine-1-phosphate N-acetyltransferase GlmU [Alphaproteobacteria bacterium]|jgi:bifunctional UDP-N-acetylglucosamine pyrophosphorylase/glucosamine-1-phosphate N-acetyltransferase|nr:bifunctional UDP-N-acetylglucosamine diphosphorylase/glucosamine-1-phosphate N-acetyltransferase GlmU [Alphaproteobacteria bacterium]MDC1209874.1 bifunctional UDP-N-acetylglucosamine diphosphorylase/glucosamine-1-phosphate N-acetyltransferase GlmU [Pseudomonadota bacterium]|tara:strand:- start:2581 stop:3873 length:1293 start_codon:yes stop_codon:yes gene_type:complete
MNICSIILSAGKGNRMQSSIPKPLHTISGKTMLQWVIDANIAAKITKYVIVIPKDNKEIEAVTKDLETVVQPIPLGTGDAVIQAKKILKDFNGIIIICFADTPFIAPETLKKLTKAVKNGSKIAISGFKKSEKNNYGKIVFSKSNQPSEIVEEKDAKIRKIKSEYCNGGIIAINSEILNYLDKIKSNKLTKEIYLTEIVKLAFLNKEKIDFIEINENEILGINNQIELSKAEKISQDFLRNKAMINGAKLIAPETVFFNFDTKIGKDVVIHPNVIFGKNVNIEKSVEILSFSHIEDSVIKEGSVIGPFARLRGKAIIGPKSKIGNFVEIKNSKLKEQVKINHLSYVGDSEIGKSTNIGAGTITCNYDGKKKNKTKIGSNSFIGSNSSLIAPIKIGDNVTLAAGSVFNKNVPSNSLSIGRAHQVIKKIKTN